ncbi:MAG: SRPBCC domain-containing protein [Chloroflexota bacterium]|mgnify:CR=1 FL=1|nr:SRPBCC domain-containing protein [Chloroflexota bacterium]
MQITGSYPFNFDRQAVWNILMQPAAIAKAIPGIKDMLPIEGESSAWRAVAKLNAAAVSGLYAGVVRMSEIEAPNRYRLHISGEGQQSVISGTALISLRDGATPNQTMIDWTVEAGVSGKLAAMPPRLVKVAAILFARDFFGGLAKQLGAVGEAPPVSE